jgi:unconventional prefoldin RPB5 interactor 1
MAFVKGHIIHTNELHVLLGDNYFALRSARQSSKIIDRRLHDVQRNLKEAEDAKKKTQDWLRATEDHKREREQFVEIIETM